MISLLVCPYAIKIIYRSPNHVSVTVSQATFVTPDSVKDLASRERYMIPIICPNDPNQFTGFPQTFYPAKISQK